MDRCLNKKCRKVLHHIGYCNEGCAIISMGMQVKETASEIYGEVIHCEDKEEIMRKIMQKHILNNK